MLQQHLGEVFLTAAQRQSQRRIVVATEQPHTRGLHRRDDQPCLPAGNLPQRRRAGLLNLAVG